ncbi:MAG: hypothetical protein AAGH99_14085 [Planctomycetota bacterium]
MLTNYEPNGIKPAPIISLDDDLIGQSAIGRRYGVSPASVSRHMTQGVSIGGQRLKLPSIRIAGRRYTTEASLQWWFTAQQQLDQTMCQQRDSINETTSSEVSLAALTNAALEELAESEGI